MRERKSESEQGLRGRSVSGPEPSYSQGKGVPVKAGSAPMPCSPWLDLNLHSHGNRRFHEVWLTAESGASGHHSV